MASLSSRGLAAAPGLQVTVQSFKRINDLRTKIWDLISLFYIFLSCTESTDSTRELSVLEYFEYINYAIKNGIYIITH